MICPEWVYFTQNEELISTIKDLLYLRDNALLLNCLLVLL